MKREDVELVARDLELQAKRLREDFIAVTAIRVSIEVDHDFKRCCMYSCNKATQPPEVDLTREWVQDENGMFYYQLDPEKDGIPGRMYASLPQQEILRRRFVD